MFIAQRHSHCRQQSASKGFTLVELLVVIGIIALLISILLPALGRARSQAARVACLANQHSVILSILMYAGDNQGLLPGPCVPVVVDPLYTNYQPGYGAVVGNTRYSQIAVWNGLNQYYEFLQLSNINLLQKYLGGIGSRNVWFCPASTDIRNATANVGFLSTYHPGWGYAVNNYQTNASGIGYGYPMAMPSYLFGAYSAIGSGSPAVTETDRKPKKLTNILGAISGNVDANGNLAFTRDLSKVWIISDFDGRNGVSTVSGSFNITGDVGYSTTPGVITAKKNAYPYQPVHTISKAMPNGLGRNYTYLDGHGEFKLFNDWPGASFGAN